MNYLPDSVTIVEVGPRDGLQNEKKQLTTEQRVDFINRLNDCGLPVIECGSMVNPKWVPQLADSEAVLRGIDKKSGTDYPVLVPNEKGMERALAAGAETVAIFVAASEEFNQKNVNCSIDESFTRFEAVMKLADEHRIKVRGYLSCVLGCPYAGKVKPMKVATVARRLHELGCYEISLGDTIGIGTPLQARRMIDVVSTRVPRDRLAIHFHDTRGQALANIFACLESGIATIDAAVAGLGGCPYANGSSGNVATEDVVYMLQGLGIECGIDLQKLSEVGNWICQRLSHDNLSRVGRLYQ